MVSLASSINGAWIANEIACTNPNASLRALAVSILQANKNGAC